VVQSRLEYRGSIIACGIEVYYLPTRMGSRVGAAGASNAYGFSRQLSDGLFQLALDSGRTGLPLKAGVIGAVVLHHQCDPAAIAMLGASGCQGVNLVMAIPHKC
jgi:hypothetical protein